MKIYLIVTILKLISFHSMQNIFLLYLMALLVKSNDKEKSKQPKSLNYK